MLVRASRRKFQQGVSRNLQPSLEDLHLPWLCPALHREIRRQGQHPRKTSTIAHVQSTKDPRQSLIRLSTSSATELRPQHRGLASAATLDYEVPQDEFVPFEGSPIIFRAPSTVHSPWSPQRDLSTLRDFDPTSAIIIKDSLFTTPRRFRSNNAISGELDEIRQTLHTCLQVGRLQRAAALMRRLNSIYKPKAPELLAAHNDYLRELSWRIVRTRDQNLLKDVQKWFEVDLRGKGVTADATTYFLMIQASLQEVLASEVDRTVRRYLDLAAEAGLRDQVMNLMMEIMNEQDFGRITRIAPTYIQQAEETFDDETNLDIPTPATPSQEALDTVSEIRGMGQKGLGLTSLKKSLALFTDSSAKPFVNEFEGSEEEKHEAYAYERQKRLERDVYGSAIDRWREEDAHLKKLGINNALKQGSIGGLMWTWHEALVPLIREEVRKCNEAEKMTNRSDVDTWRCLFGPFLQYISPEKLSAITILTCMTIQSTEGVDERGQRISRVVLVLGQAIQDESIAESIRKNGDHNNWRDFSQSERVEKLNNLIKKRQTHDSLAKLIRNSQPSEPTFESLEWSIAVKTRIGAILLSHLLEIAKLEVSCKDPETGVEVQEMQPVFFHAFQYTSGKRVGVTRFNKAMLGRMGKEPVKSVLTKHLPMVVKPKPWTGFRNGGFLESPTMVVRLRQNDQQSQRYARTASENGDMAQVFAGLDVLASTPWKINRDVFDVMLETWNTGEGIAKIAPENPWVDFPPEPPPSDDYLIRLKWHKEMKRLENERSGIKSQRCFQNFQLEVAKAYLKEEFYFPHNVDFRGRAYPLSPFLNHMGADNCRGLLMFGKGKELGSSGLDWLKIHLASLFGFDKASFEERKKFTQDRLSQIYDSANRPLQGNRWWLKAEDPWQCLAACIELKNALDAPDPCRFVSHIPIHQDGTCNGLQHYAALGGDVIGAKQVNLEPSDRPSDIYSAVAEMVKVEIVDEAAQGSEIARLLDGKITRKIVKQPVMTNVYGVTFAGARAQVRKQLEDLYPDFPNTATLNLGTASHYIAKKIFKTLSSMFNGAHDIQFWLADCAARISDALTPEQLDWLESHDEDQNASEPSPYRKKPIGKKPIHRGTAAFKSSVIWTTPLKMPVVQPYRNANPQSVMTNLQKISIAAPSAADPVNKRKQTQGFPPNFIHSLDATHMILSALKCDELGLTFAAVHDSFWTHAADVVVMNGIIRDTFIRMHSEDIIGRLAAEFTARYKGSMYLACVKRHSPVGRKIFSLRKSTARGGESLPHSRIGFAARTKELFEERRRLKLLASDDPKERMEGESMITPGKIYAQTSNEKDLIPDINLEEIAIGHVPSVRSTKLQANEQIEVGDMHNLDASEASHMDPEAAAVDGGVNSAGLAERTDEAADDTDAGLTAKERQVKERKLALKIWLWLPLTFAPVPKKGEYDVSRLKGSSYFFS